jgi:phospholipase C
MSSSSLLSQARQHLVVGTSRFALLVNLGAPVTSAAQEPPEHSGTATPIKHVIVIIGENRTFDQVFATYQPKRREAVSNLLSKGIVNSDGSPGPNFSLASQSSANDSSTDGYQLNPSNNAAYSVLPPVLAGGYSTPPFPDLATAKFYENGLPDNYYIYLTTGGTGLNHGDVDTRVPNATTLPSGPFQLTSKTHPYDAYDNSPVHRFYQMWQQFDCRAANATKQNPSGCLG